MAPLISTPHLHGQGLFIVQVFENRLASNTRGMCTHSWSLSVSSNSDDTAVKYVSREGLIQNFDSI